MPLRTRASPRRDASDQVDASPPDSTGRVTLSALSDASRACASFLPRAPNLWLTTTGQVRQMRAVLRRSPAKQQPNQLDYVGARADAR
jgi:hypothetical protein